MLLCGLIILAQLGLIAYLIYASSLEGMDHINPYYILLIVYLISIIFSIYIMCKDEKAEYKLPWIITILILPIFGIAIYIIFGHINIRKKDIRRLNSIYEEANKPLNSNISTIIDDNNFQYVSQFNYLNSYEYFVVNSKNNITYYSMGDDFVETFLNDLRSAKEFILLEYYIIARGKLFNQILDILKEKVKQGVDVKVIYDDFGSLLDVEAYFYKSLNKLGIECVAFNKFKPFLSSIYNNRDHRKMTVIDGKIGYTGGLNLADEYVNYISKFGTWKDGVIRIEGECVNAITVAILTMFNFSNLKKKIDYSKYIKPIDENIPNQGLTCLYFSGPKQIYQDNISKNVYLNLINSARYTIDISTPYLVIDNEMLNAMYNAIKRGVKISILIPKKPDKKSIYALTKYNAYKLYKKGAKIYTYSKGFNHAKLIVVDSIIGSCGTVNFDYRSFIHNFEDGVLMYDSKAVIDIKKDLDSCFTEENIMSEKQLKTNAFKSLLISLLSIFSPFF